MADQRIKGQEVQLMLVVDGNVQSLVTDFKSLELTFKLEKKEEGYIGETTNRYDEIFNGIDGRIEFHFENQTILDLILQIVDRARRRQPGTRVNVKTTLNFPNGQSPRVLLSDCFFGPIPLGFAGRAEYGKVDFDFSTSDVRKIA